MSRSAVNTFKCSGQIFRFVICAFACLEVAPLSAAGFYFISCYQSDKVSECFRFCFLSYITHTLTSSCL